MANEQISEITTVPTNATIIKIINTLIKRYNSLGSIYTFKGSVQTYAELLAIENPNVGDVYNVVQEDEEHQIAAGSNFVWDGTVWDNLGGSLAGLVQSVNGINPDSLGNVLLPLIKGVSVSGGNIVFTKNDDTNVNVNNVKKLFISTLGENVDLNNIKESGVYICASNANAANYENCPIQKAFLLEVQASDSGNFVYQFLTRYNDGSTEAGNQYTRTYHNGNWSAWRMAGSGSNLTTYTSLEQLGITPGKETFESIHNALPLNSELVYDITPNNFNNSIYPNESYGQMRCSKISDFTSTNFMFIVQDINVLNIYTRYFNQNFPTNVVEWSLLAKQSGLTNLSNSVVKSVNGIKPTNGNVTIDIPKPVIASEAEAKAGTNNTKFMTPLRVAQALAANNRGIVSANLAQNGYVKFANGFILQWGILTKNASSFTVTLPLTLQNTDYKVFTQLNPKGGFMNEWSNTQYPKTLNKNNFTIETPYRETKNMYNFWLVVAF